MANEIIVIIKMPARFHQPMTRTCVECTESVKGVVLEWGGGSGKQGVHDFFS